MTLPIWMHLLYTESTGAAAAAAAGNNTVAAMPPIYPSSASSNNSFRIKTSFQHVLRDIPVPRALQEGIPVLRVYANGKTTKTTLSLSSDNFTIYVKQKEFQQSKSSKIRWSFTSNKQKGEQENRVIDIGAISKIQRGHARRRFELARYVPHYIDALHCILWQVLMLHIHTSIHLYIFSLHRSRTDSIKSIMSTVSLDAASTATASTSQTSMDVLDPSQCFSIIFRGDWTLDLMILASSASSSNSDYKIPARDEILNALDKIIWTYQQAKVMVSNDVLLLRYVWREADKVSMINYQSDACMCRAFPLMPTPSFCAIV